METIALPGIDIHMGSIVLTLLKEKRMKHNTLAEYLPQNKSNISRMLDRPDWRISEVMAASRALKVNLFTYIVDTKNPVDMVSEDTPLYYTSKLQSELTAMTDKYNQEKKLCDSYEQANKLLTEKVRNLELELRSLKTQPKTK